MNKKLDFAAGLSKLKPEAPAPAPLPERQTDRAEVKAGATYILPESRIGKVAISAYFEPAVRQQLAILAVRQQKTQANLLAEALNLLFEQYGESPIARA